MLNYKMIKKVIEIRQKMLKVNVNKLMKRKITVIKKAGTVQSLYNTPHYNTDLHILWSYWGSQ